MAGGSGGGGGRSGGGGGGGGRREGTLIFGGGHGIVVGQGGSTLKLDLSRKGRGAMSSIAATHLTLCQALLDVLHIGKAYRPTHSKD